MSSKRLQLEAVYSGLKRAYLEKVLGYVLRFEAIGSIAEWFIHLL